MNEDEGMMVDDDNFVVDDEGKPCEYVDEDEYELDIVKKQGKIEPKNSIMHLLPNMANQQPKEQKKDLKKIQKGEELLKGLFNQLDDPIKKSGNSGVSNGNNFSSFSTFSNGNVNSQNNNLNKNNNYKLNPSFLPEFELKLNTKLNSGNKAVNNQNNINNSPQVNNQNTIQEMSLGTPSVNVDESIVLPGREKKAITPVYDGNSSLKRKREEINSTGKEDNSNNIFLHRTPVSNNKIPNTNMNMNNTIYYTPNSHITEDRSYINNRSMSNNKPNDNANGNIQTPIRALNNDSYFMENSNTNTNQTGISMRQSKTEKLPVNSDGSISVYWYDAIEEQIQTKISTVILFGKIYDPAVNSHSSIALVLKNLMRTVYLFPKIKGENDESYKENFGKMYEEFEYLRRTKFSYIKNFQCKEVKRKYCFELPIPHKEYSVLKVKYPSDQTLPANLSGETFDYVFGRNNNLLEKVLLSRKMKGPSWLKITNFEQPTNFNVTWCKYEVVVSDYKKIEIDNSNTFPTPPLKLLSMSTKTINNNGTNELLAISAIMKDNYYIEDEKGLNKMEMSDPSNSFVIIMRKYDPSGLKLDQYDMFKNKFGNGFVLGQNENALINQFINRVSIFDPDVVVGHNLYTGHMETLFNRISKLKITNWSRIGKLKREVLPKFLQNSSLGNIYVRSCMVGRLILDTYVSCRDILRENNYQLSHLSQKYLNNQILDELEVNNLLANSSANNTWQQDFDNILVHTLRESELSLLLMDKLSILPLTKQLTNIAGNLWIKSLQNSRADRCEMLLMHEFNKLKYILPDKLNKGEKLDMDEYNDEKEDSGTGKRKPQYSGGLVLEPEVGLYDSTILLLDFNSLYPSIIQEYNICFTTVMRKSTQCFNYIEERKNKKNDKPTPTQDNNNTEEATNEPEIDLTAVKKIKEKAILPTILESLVYKRKQIKEQMKKEKDKFKLSLLEIKQKAIKLSANSLYGYLGYKNSRFYAKSIAALITSTGRNILKDTVELVKTKHNLHVIYGDTDSIMINTLTNDIKKALELGAQCKKSVNEKYRLLEMEMDGVFKTLLLLKKKKYAAMKYEPPYDANSKVTKETKGLDLVRRDWCDISKQVGYAILETILNVGNKEEIINLIFDLLKEVSKNIDTDFYPLSFFEITKQLTKNVEDYADAKALPHVKVAKRLKEKGDLTIKSGIFIPYVVCIDKSNENTSNAGKSLADRCFSPKEMIENPNLVVDINWYKENQILASVSRLCKHIKEIDMFHLAECLGIDPNKYIHSKDNANPEDNFISNDTNEDTIIHMAKNGIKITCSKCLEINKITSIKKNSTNITTLLKCEKVFINVNIYFSVLLFQKITILFIITLS